ncbi:PREDICTED: sodium/hydrogen exchanger 9B1-like [Propithecus coquereli]|uniref:sodium/hydrogen exchanger 9B1-like n=1 Tax=Propithecus coquereli TaxID=379532 RepID=UPI00063EF151|nr:PREDICTED: sodium/hydrogen exchanger 9B1-like [Propithecus coquereli]
MHTTESKNEHVENKNSQTSTIPQILTTPDRSAQEETAETVLSETEETKPQMNKSKHISWPPQGILNLIITNGVILFMIWCIMWSFSGSEVLPGGNLFGVLIIFYSAFIGGKLLQLIRIPSVPPLPPLLGMLLAGFIIRNVPFISDHVQVHTSWSSILRNTALTIILIRAGLGLDPQALKNLKRVCLRLSVGPCLMEACAGAFFSHFIMKFPWEWGFLLGYLYSFSTYSRGRNYVEGSIISNLLSSVRDIFVGVLAGIILGFFVQYFPSGDQEKITLKYSTWIGVQKIISKTWNIFQPLLFGLVGSEVSVSSLESNTIGICVATMSLALCVRILATYILMCFAGFSFKEKIFIALSWMPKATVQAVLGPLALETARVSAPHLESYSRNVMTVAFLAILITAPNGALFIGLLGPKILTRHYEPRKIKLQMSELEHH